MCSLHSFFCLPGNGSPQTTAAAHLHSACSLVAGSAAMHMDQSGRCPPASLLFWAQGRQVATLFLHSRETGREVWTPVLSLPSCLAHSQSATFRSFNEQISDMCMRVPPFFVLWLCTDVCKFEGVPISDDVAADWLKYSISFS